MKHNRHFMSTYFLLDPFEFPYYFYRIRKIMAFAFKCNSIISASS